MVLRGCWLDTERCADEGEVKERSSWSEGPHEGTSNHVIDDRQWSWRYLRVSMVFSLEDWIGDDDIALGPHVDEKTCGTGFHRENHHHFQHRFLLFTSKCGPIVVSPFLVLQGTEVNLNEEVSIR